MNNNKIFLIFAATAIAGSVGGVMVALQSQRTQPDANNSPHAGQVSESVAVTATTTTTSETTENTETPTTPTPTSAATSAAPSAATSAAPSAATSVATSAAPSAATSVATSAAPSAATSAAPSAATPTSTPEKVPPIEIAPPTEGCKITQAMVADPNPPLNVRSIPRVTSNNQVGTLENGTFVSVVGEESDWFRIDRPVQGWISKQLTKSSCSNVSEKIQFPENGISAIVKGEIIGGGSHQYILEASAGQTMTVEKLKSDSVFPTIISPNGKVLAGDPYTDTDDRTQWVGQLPTSGDYRLEMNSNFKGFEYEFLVEIK